jgi:transcriptional regulator with XRE-family HTH domain
VAKQQIFLERSIPRRQYQGMIDLAAIRNATGLTQIELAARLGVGQAAVSKIERQTDMLLGTLSAYLTALGADARLIVTVGGQTFSGVLMEGDDEHHAEPNRDRGSASPRSLLCGVVSSYR